MSLEFFLLPLIEQKPRRKPDRLSKTQNSITTHNFEQNEHSVWISMKCSNITCIVGTPLITSVYNWAFSFIWDHESRLPAHRIVIIRPKFPLCWLTDPPTPCVWLIVANFILYQTPPISEGKFELFIPTSQAKRWNWRFFTLLLPIGASLNFSLFRLLKNRTKPRFPTQKGWKQEVQLIREGLRRGESNPPRTYRIASVTMWCHVKSFQAW